MKNLKTFEDFKQLEGVADKYAQRVFNIPDTTNGYISEYEEDKPFGYVNGIGFTGKFSTPVYKNPKSLNNFEPNVRAIVDIDGNLYVAKEDNPFSHYEMNKEIGLTDFLYIYDNPNFLLLNRIEETNDFGFSSSGYRRIEGKSNIDKIIIDILKKTKKKNSNFDFYISQASPRFISDKNKIII